jgi:hypothetical protein
MSRKRTRTQRRSSLKDHAWGVVLGLVFVVFLGIVFLGGRITGAGAATCDRPLGPMSGGTNITAAGFADEDAALGHVIDFFYAGDRTSADAAFYGPVHSFTHNADPVVRTGNPDTAKALCSAVIKLENNLASPGTSNVELAQDTTAVRDALRDAAVALGNPRPGGPS